jgi:hypothetical protein
VVPYRVPAQYTKTHRVAALTFFRVRLRLEKKVLPLNFSTDAKISSVLFDWTLHWFCEYTIPIIQKYTKITIDVA